MLTILDRYIFKRLFVPYIYGFFGFIVIIAITPLVDSMQYMISRKIPPQVVLSWFLNRIPEDMVFTFPMAMLLASLMVFGQMSKDSEIIAIKATGISVHRLMIPILLFALAVTILGLFFTEYIVPHTNLQAREIKSTKILSIPEDIYRQNIFLRISNDQLLYANKMHMQKNILYNVLVVSTRENRLYKRIAAKRAEYSNNKWVFSKVIITEENPDRTGNVNEFDTRYYSLNGLIPDDLKKEEKRPKEMSMREIGQIIKRRRELGLGEVTKLKVELYLKSAIPFSTFIFSFIGISMGLRRQRGGGGMIGFGVCILVIFAYYVVMSISRSYGRLGVLPPILAAWLQNFIFGGIGLYFISKADT